MFRLLVVAVLVVVASSPSLAQTGERKTSVSVLDFGTTAIAASVTSKIRTNLHALVEFNILDAEMTSAAARGIGYTGSLNMSVVEARDLGAALSSEFFIIGDAQTLRRTSSEKPIYYESYCSIFIVSSRSGRLILWERPSFQDASPKSAEDLLLQSLSSPETIARYRLAIKSASEDEARLRSLILDPNEPKVEEAPDDEENALNQGLRLPRPYRRLRPAYPDAAARAEAEATVDVVVDVGSDGEVSQVQVARWAGFGLDEATVTTVRQMHFFPAMRSGSAIPMRVLLRYNFRKPPK